MDAKGIAFSAQNEMLAKLAPLHRDFISKLSIAAHWYSLPLH
jgi:hypothetical protein